MQFFAGKPCAPGYDQIKVGDVSDANPAAPAPARGSKAVLTEVTPAAKLLIVGALGEFAAKSHCDLGVRWDEKGNKFAFHLPEQCTYGVATAAVVNSALNTALEAELQRPVAPLAPLARSLLTTQVNALKETVTAATAALVKTEGDSVDTAPLLLFIFGTALVNSRVYLCPRDMDYELSLFTPCRTWLREEMVQILNERQLKLAKDTQAAEAAARAAEAAAREAARERDAALALAREREREAARRNHDKGGGGGGGGKGGGGGGKGGDKGGGDKGADKSDWASWTPWCARPGNRDIKCTKERCPLHGPKREGLRAAGHARSACIVLREGKGGDPKECIKGEGAIKDYYSKHPTEKVPGEDQSFLDANRE